jgi:hypothetical protein
MDAAGPGREPGGVDPVQALAAEGGASGVGAAGGGVVRKPAEMLCCDTGSCFMTGTRESFALIEEVFGVELDLRPLPAHVDEPGEYVAPNNAPTSRESSRVIATSQEFSGVLGRESEDPYTAAIRGCLSAQAGGANFNDLCSWLRGRVEPIIWGELFHTIEDLEREKVIEVERVGGKVRWVKRGRAWG